MFSGAVYIDYILDILDLWQRACEDVTTEEYKTEQEDRSRNHIYF